MPPYPNAMVGILVNQNFYQQQSADDPATVTAWYKAHVAGATWNTDASDVTLTTTTVGGVNLVIYKNTLTANGADKVKTMIEMHRR